jgi:hypothetical protein
MVLRIPLRRYPIQSFNQVLWLNKKAPVVHDLLFFDPYVESQTDNIDMRSRCPGSARVLAIRIAEGNVDAGELLVLEDVADDILDAEIGANGELAYAI